MYPTQIRLFSATLIGVSLIMLLLFYRAGSENKPLNYVVWCGNLAGAFVALLLGVLWPLWLAMGFGGIIFVVQWRRGDFE